MTIWGNSATFNAASDHAQLIVDSRENSTIVKLRLETALLKEGQLGVACEKGDEVSIRLHAELIGLGVSIHGD